MHELIGFGYWCSLYEPTLPDPAWFVDTQWEAATRQAVIGYLHQGRSLRQYMGYSWCRFRCEVSIVQMGAGDLTDGTYCWPEGLLHYLRHHAVRLPDAVVQHVLSQPAFPHSKAARTELASPVDMTWWASQIGWHATTNSFLSADDEEQRTYLRRFDQGKLDFSDYLAEGVQAIKRMVLRLRDANRS
jgi:hypothetical protein